MSIPHRFGTTSIVGVQNVYDVGCQSLIGSVQLNQKGGNANGSKVSIPHRFGTTYENATAVGAMRLQ